MHHRMVRTTVQQLLRRTLNFIFLSYGPNRRDELQVNKTEEIKQ